MAHRIVFLLEDLCFGGTQRQTLQLALRLDRSRFEPVILTLTGETDLDDEARSGGLPVHHMNTGRKVDPFFFLRLCQELQKLDADVLVPCTALPNIWGRIWGCLLKKKCGRPLGIVGTVRGGGAPKRQYESLLWRLCDHMICNSQALQDVLRKKGVPAGLVTCIPNGVDTDRFAPADPAPEDRDDLIVCVARLCEDKDQATLIHAFEKAAAVNPAARLRLVGDGPWEAKVRKEASSSPYHDRIEVVPGTQDVRPHLSQAKLFALSSVREGQPNVLLEAMASGLPVCATAVGGIPAMITPRNGLLSPAGDSQALADNMLQILGDRELVRSMSLNNRAKAVSDYSFDAMVSAHEAVFEKLCAE